MDSYFGSERHRESMKDASKLGTIRLKELVKERIDAYNTSPNKCQWCGIDLVYDRKNNKFCSSSCAAQHNNRNRQPMSIETKDRIRKAVIGNLPWNKGLAPIITKKCVVCGSEFNVERLQFKSGSRLSKAKCCSGECGNTLMRQSVQIKANERVANRTHSGWMTRPTLSYAEKFFDQVLKDRGLEGKYHINFPVNKRKELGLCDDSNYFLDFYFPDFKLDLEIDGKQHKYTDRVEHDKERDLALINKGYDVYRIEWQNINTEEGKKYIANEIDNFIQYYQNKHRGVAP